MKMHNDANELREVINGVYEDLVMLCEVRGELDPESNKKTEDAIAALMQKKAYAEAQLLKLTGEDRKTLNG